MNLASVSSGARRFFDISEALCRAVGNAIRPGFIQLAVAIVVVRRIQRVRNALLALEARFLAGRLVVRGPVAVTVARRAANVGVATPPAVRLPRRFAWLCVLVPSEAATYAGHMRIVLAEPGMMALLEACPQAVRVVQPLCRMLGIERADYVPGERATPAAVAVTEADVAEMAVVARPALVVAELDLVSQMALVTVGLGWVRFIPG